MKLTAKPISIDQLIIPWGMIGDYENCIWILHKTDHLSKLITQANNDESFKRCHKNLLDTFHDQRRT
jgi:hypothetical protein